MVVSNNASGNEGLAGTILRKARDFISYLGGRLKGTADLNGKILLIDNDELLLVWESELRNRRLKKEEAAWKGFEKQFGKGTPEVADAFIKWQEHLYAYIEQEKDRFLTQRPGTKEGLDVLVRAGAKNIVVTQGAKPYTEKCFNLVGFSGYISDIFSPARGKREKRFVDAVLENGKTSTVDCLRDVIIVGHDPEKDMAWDLVPSRCQANDGNAPVLVLFDALKFAGTVDAPLDALAEIVALLSKRGKKDFLRGFKSITRPAQARTKNYTFRIALYHNPKRKDKARIPVICDIQRRV